VVRSSAAASATVTQSLTPSNDRALPNRPAVVQTAPATVPACPPPEASPAVVPVPSLKPYAATGPVDAPWLLTVTVTAVEVVRLPAASRARAVSVWAPLAAVVVFQDTLYGAVVSSVPKGAPSSRNCTPATPTLSEASAVTATVPATVAPPAGLVTLTAGGVASGVNVKRIALPLPTWGLVPLNWTSSRFAPWVPLSLMPTVALAPLARESPESVSG
jgi:hypothetical protein